MSYIIDLFLAAVGAACDEKNENHCLSLRVITDLGTDFEPHLVHCVLNRCQSNFVDRH